MALDEPNKNEEMTQINGIHVLISNEVKPFADRNKIDYLNSPGEQGFIISSADQTCC